MPIWNAAPSTITIPLCSCYLLVRQSVANGKVAGLVQFRYTHKTSASWIFHCELCLVEPPGKRMGGSGSAAVNAARRNTCCVRLHDKLARRTPNETGLATSLVQSSKQHEMVLFSSQHDAYTCLISQLPELPRQEFYVWKPSFSCNLSFWFSNLNKSMSSFVI